MRLSAALLIVTLALPAWGGRCPVPAGASPTLGDIDAATRLEFVRRRLDRAAHRARVWTWTWGTIVVVATAFNLALVPFDKTSDQHDDYLAAATTLPGLAPFLFLPLAVMKDAHRIDQAAQAGGPDECAVLADAERTMVHDADNEADGRAWWLHVANVGINVGIGVLFGELLGHWKAGLYNGLFGFAAGELIILTQPVDAVDALHDYRRGQLGAPVTELGFAPLVGHGTVGLSVVGTF